MSEKLIGYCGIQCSECPAYIAKKNDDDELRKKTVAEWSSDEWPMSAEDINCDGCTTDGELAKFCATCEVYKCGSEKGVTNCAHCVDYPCEKLEMPWSISSDAQKVLDDIRKSLS